MRKYLKLLLAFALVLLLTSCGETVESDDNTSSLPQNETESVVPAQSKIDWFISEYNSVAETPITDTVEFDVKDRDSGHYRIEFRLTSFAEAEAKTGKIGDANIDIIAHGYDLKTASYANQEIRIYVDGITIEQAKEIIKTASPILDNSLTDADIEEVLLEIDKGQSLNGCYYGELGLTFTNGELMLKAE